jgi:integrase
MARAKALRCRQQWLDGIDPIEARNKTQRDAAADSAKAVTFGDCARRFYAEHRPKWGASHGDRWLASLENHIFPAIGNEPVGAVDLAMVIKALEPIWNIKPSTASRLRGRIENVLDFAKVSGWRDGDNPAAWSLLSKRFASARSLRPIVHMSAMRWQDVPAFVRELRQKTDIAASALEFTILAWVRPREAREARYDEIDMEAATWTVPASRMKSKREHRVPLSAAAVAVLKRMAEIR